MRVKQLLRERKEPNKEVKVDCCRKQCETTISEESQSFFAETYKSCSSAKEVRKKCAYYKTRYRYSKAFYVKCDHKTWIEVCAEFFYKLVGKNTCNLKKPVVKLLSSLNREKIVNHINSFPQFKSETSDTTFLLPHVTFTLMYSNFTNSWTEDNPGVKPPSISAYKHVFYSLDIEFTEDVALVEPIEMRPQHDNNAVSVYQAVPMTFDEEPDYDDEITANIIKSEC